MDAVVAASLVVAAARSSGGWRIAAILLAALLVLSKLLRLAWRHRKKAAYVEVPRAELAADDDFAQMVAREEKLHRVEFLEQLLQRAIVEILHRPHLVARRQ